MTISTKDIVLACAIGFCIGVTVILVVCYKTLTERARSYKLRYEEASAHSAEMSSQVASYRAQMATLDARNERLVASIREGQTALLVSLNTQLKETEQRAIEAKQAAAKVVAELPPAEPNDKDMGLAIFEELTLTHDLSELPEDVKAQIEDNRERPERQRPRARPASRAKEVKSDAS